MDNELATKSNDEQVINVVSKKEKRAIVKKCGIRQLMLILQ